MVARHEMENKIKEAADILRNAGAEEVYVFGSYVERREDPVNDIDLAVSGLPPEVFFRAMGAASEVFECPLDLIDLDEDTPFVKFLREKGKLRRVG